jgi:hypothetical protein
MRCQTCKYGVPNVAQISTNPAHQQGNTLQCKSRPPAVGFVPIPIQTSQGMGVQVQIVSGWPSVQPGDFCSFYESSHGSRLLEE